MRRRPPIRAAVKLRFDRYSRARHARYFEPGVVYTIVSRTQQNKFLLRPDNQGKLRAIIIGVLSKAAEKYPNVANHAAAFLSNHLHLQLSIAKHGAHPGEICDYVGFIKREIARRWNKEMGTKGSIWEGFDMVAVLTGPAQVNALKYILAQTVKERLVEHPFDWPGFHCAESLVTGEPMEGIWFNGTAYGKKLHAERAKKNGIEPNRDDYIEKRTFSFDPLPALAHLSPEDYRAEMQRLVEEVVVEAREARGDKPVLGVDAICSADREQSRPVPSPPWFEKRRKQIVWDNPRETEVSEYVARYWKAQEMFRKASARWRAQNNKSTRRFPAYMCVPGFWPGRRRVRPPSHQEQSTG